MKVIELSVADQTWLHAAISDVNAKKAQVNQLEEEICTLKMKVSQKLTSIGAAYGIDPCVTYIYNDALSDDCRFMAGRPIEKAVAV